MALRPHRIKADPLCHHRLAHAVLIALVCMLTLPLSAAEQSETSCAQYLIDTFSRYGGNEVTPESIQQKMKRYDGGELFIAQQSSSLKTNLKAHGYDCGNLDGYKCLKKLSSENVRRLLEGFSIEKAVGSPKDEALYDLIRKSYRMVFIHNSHHLHKKVNIPIVSSKRLEELGLGPGGNTGAFNVDVLKGNDNVYFFASRNFNTGEVSYRGKKSEYGSKVCTPDEQYARDFGWISPFVMYASELEDFAFSAFGKRAKIVNQIMEKNEQLRLAKFLHLFDFTVGDFEELMNALTFKKLLELRDGDPVRFQTIVESMESLKERRQVSKDLRAFTFEVERLLGKDKDIWLDFEFKIPVAVPVGKFTVH